jgi:predicted metal-dependent hydrolase
MVGERRVEYAVRVSRIARMSRIWVRPEGVEVVLPMGMPEARAHEFLREQSAWVVRQLARLDALRSAQLRNDPPADVILFKGRRVHVDTVEDPPGAPFRITEGTNGDLSVHVPRGQTGIAARALESWLRWTARSAIAECANRRAAMMGLRFRKVTIRAQRARWGSCSRHGNLSFNWRLIMAPPEALDYVVVHELAHLAEPHHQSKFWSLVQTFCPDHRRHNAWLRKNQNLLNARGPVPVGV